MDFFRSLDDRSWRIRAVVGDVLLVDWTAPDDDFLDALRAWCRDGLKAHLLVLLPPGTRAEVRASYLDTGADACLVHPVGLEKVRAYLRALTRGPSPARTGPRSARY